MTSERAAGASLAHRNYETKPDLPSRSVPSLVWLSEIKPNFRQNDRKSAEKSPADPRDSAANCALAPARMTTRTLIT